MRHRMLVIVPVLILTIGSIVSSENHEGDQEEPTTGVADIMGSTSTLTEKEANAAINAGFERLRPVFQESCFDCHSQQTRFPWYHSLPLVGGFMNGHIEEGREHLDMTNGFPFTGEDQPIQMLHRMRDEIEEGEMPLASYRLMHWGTAIEGATRDTVFAWIDSSIALLRAVEAGQ